MSLTTEQLNTARAEAWHQAGNPLLTADEATEWLRETGVCLFLPRGQQLATAAPSFVEAVLGASNPTPSIAAIEEAMLLLRRLLDAGDAVALNLLGTAGLGVAGLGELGERPDFLATAETLPFLFALVGDKEWKRGPRGKSSPLVIEVWKLLEREGPLTALEVKEKLGRQLTEAAALRALGELWTHLRIEPVFRAGEAAAWQLLERNHLKEMQAGSTMSQAVALSALVSLYLQTVVAASGEEVEVFLSPLASRSKVRDVVKGLMATRQLGTLVLGPVEMFLVAGSLPEFSEFPETERVEGAVVEEMQATAGSAGEGGIGEGRRRFVAKRLAGHAAGAEGPGGDAPRPAKPARSFAKKAAGTSRREAGGAGGAGSDRPQRDREGQESTGRDRPGRESADRRPFVPRPGSPAGDRKPYGTRSPGGSSFNPREPWKEDRKAPAAGAGEERRPSAAGGGDRRPFTPRDGERKSFAPRGEGGERKSFAPRGDGAFKPRSDKPWPGKPQPGGKTFGERKSFTPGEGGERKPYTPGEGGERKSFAPRGDGERKSFAPRTGDRPFKPRSDAKPVGERKPFGPRVGGDRKSFTPREGGDGSFKPRSGGKPFTPREGGERKPFAPRGDGERKPYSPREGGGRAFRPGSGGKSFGERKAFTPREGGERKPVAPGEGGERSFKTSFKSGSAAKPFGGSKSFGDRKPFAPREGGERKPFTPREGGGDRPFKPRSGGKPFGGGKSFGERKPYTPREGGERKPFTPREGGDRPFKARGGGKPFGERKPFTPREGGEGAGERKPFKARPAGDRPERAAAPGARKPVGTRKVLGAARARTSPVTSSGKPRSGVRPPTGRPGPRATRPGKAGGRGPVKRTRKGPGK